MAGKYKQDFGVFEDFPGVSPKNGLVMERRGFYNDTITTQVVFLWIL